MSTASRLFATLGCLAALTACGATAAQKAPPASAILNSLRAEHPRLLATAADFKQLKTECGENKPARDWLASLTREAEALLSAPPVKYEIPDGKRLLAVSRRAKDRVLLLGLIYRLNGDPRFSDRLWRELDTVTRFKDWNPAHFLDTAEMTFAVAVGYDWLHDVWTEPQREQLRRAIVELGLNKGLPTYEKQSWWAKAIHNWNQVCNGGMAVGALAIAEEEPALAGKILHAAVTSLPRAMNEFRPDGGWGEGPGYWRYATEYNVYMLAALRTALDTDCGLSQMPGFCDTGNFPLYFTSPTGETFNYADAHSGWHGAPQLFWLATTFHNPAWAIAQRAYVHDRPSPLDLLWGAAWLKTDAPRQAAPLDLHFQGVSVVFLRGAWNDANATFVGFKGGDNRVNHGHLDLGSFVLDARGQRWITDLGADNYNLPGYFGAQRWNYYRCRAEGQNTLVIDPASTPDQDPRAQAKIVEFQSRPDAGLSIADLTAAYAAAKSVQRGIALLDRRDVLVQDEIQLKRPADVLWFAHTPASISLSTAGDSAVLEQNGERLYVRLLEPRGAAFQVLDAKPLAKSPAPSNQADNARGKHPVRKLAIQLNSVQQTRIAILFSPLENQAVDVRPLEQWRR